MISALEKILMVHKDRFAPVMAVDKANPGLVPMDFTASNQELTVDLLSDIDRFSAWVKAYIGRHHGRMGIGGYGEHRTIYQVSEVFDAGAGQREPRRLHLGVDLWCPAGTEVYCPYPGKVHSFADQNRKGDYGAVIILEHELDNMVFHTLYGHLSRSSLNFEVGQPMVAGQQIATLGISVENGWWPPHLHFQLVHDLGPWSGDYPGVCAYSDRARWLANCPDPDLILDLNRFL
jgi:peptidoglycan LD-endopeptidase LytH